MERNLSDSIVRNAGGEHFDDVLLADFANTFYGYGDYDASYWFVGMEEGGGGSFENVETRLSVWDKRGRQELEDHEYSSTGTPVSLPHTQQPLLSQIFFFSIA